MVSLLRRFSHMGSRIDSSLEKFIFHHKILGFLMIFIGMPLITLAAVCICTTLIILPIAFVFGWA